ncbi:MAG: hypothetical protein Q9169_001407 [Polycauliona sp. 2 TL-2023]
MASNLVFINTHNPQDLKSSAQRKAVRSQAAKDHSQSSSSRDDVPKRRRHRKMLTLELEVAIDDSGSSQSESPPLKTEPGVMEDELASILDKGSSTNVDYSPIVPMGSMPGGSWTYPFVLHPKGKWAPGMLAQYVSKMEVDVADLDRPGAKSSLRSLWYPMGTSGQATVNVGILTAAFQYISINSFQCKPEVLYEMKQQAITSINRGLQDPAVATSDQLIGAVAKMAAYEAGFADDHVQFHIHMKGLVKMVELRGGLRSLGLNGLLARMLLWIDLNAAFLLQSRPYFPR